MTEIPKAALPAGPELDARIARIIGWRQIGAIVWSMGAGENTRTYNTLDGNPPPFSTFWAYAGHVNDWLQAQGFRFYTNVRPASRPFLNLRVTDGPTRHGVCVEVFTHDADERIRAVRPFSRLGDNVPHALALACDEAARRMEAAGVPFVALAPEEYPHG